MITRLPCATGEWYHCYNRGTDKRNVFMEKSDYDRFLALLYVCNSTRPITIADRYTADLRAILTDTSLDRGEQLVDIGAYSLMPTHPHLLLKQRLDGGIARFMQKVFTGYTMYFNLKYVRSGSLFAGTYKAKHIADDRYLKQVVPYILLNAAELFEPNWKNGVGNAHRMAKQLAEYPYSNFPEFAGIKRIEKKIMSDSIYEYYEQDPEVGEMVANALEYFSTHSPEV